MVFVRLANADPKLESDGALAGWLHRTAVHVSVDMWRAETRRSAREQKHAVDMETAETEPVWAELAPHLDHALDQLSEEDRQVLLLRFFAKQRMSEIGRSLGIREDAVKMRVSRAIDRLRVQLKAGGVVCSVAGLGVLLTENSVQAAPAVLAAGIAGLKLAAPAVANGAGLISSGTGAAVAAACAVGLLVYLGWPSHPAARIEAQASAAPPAPQAQSQAARATEAPASAPPPEAERSATISGKYSLSLHVVDAETGQDIPNARIRASYFYEGGVPEAHNLQTDPSGRANIPKARLGGDPGMNVFVSAEFHVPRCLMWGRTRVREYTMRLDRAIAIGGVVVDGAGHPVEGVNIEISAPGRAGIPEADHPVFHGGSSLVSSDAQGNWLCPYVPTDWESVKLSFTHPDFAVTDVELSTAQLANNRIVIQPGFTIAGIVTDTNGLPLAGVSVRESHNWGRRAVSTKTDGAGSFELRGLKDFYPHEHEEPSVNLAFQTAGYACQMETVKLLAPTNNVRIFLTPGNLFHGRLLDEDGYPIANAVVRTDAGNQGLVKFRWLTRTDRDGRFSWDSAPAEATLFWFEAEGFKTIRDLPLVPDGTEHQVVMKKGSP